MGTAQLFFAIMTSKLPRDVSAPIPLTTARLWRWLASLLNLGEIAIIDIQIDLEYMIL
jgi:GLE1-like protein